MKNFIDWLFWKRTWFRICFVAIPTLPLCIGLLITHLFECDTQTTKAILINLIGLVWILAVIDNSNMDGCDSKLSNNLKNNSSIIPFGISVYLSIGKWAIPKLSFDKKKRGLRLCLGFIAAEICLTDIERWMGKVLRGYLEKDDLLKKINSPIILPKAITLPEDVNPEDIVYAWEPSDYDKRNDWEDVANFYLVRKKEGAAGGLIVYGLYRNEWYANPQLRHLVNKMLKDMGRIMEDSEKQKQFEQCNDCHSNWRFIPVVGGKQDRSGHCFMYKEYQPNCIKKQKINDYR